MTTTLSSFPTFGKGMMSTMVGFDRMLDQMLHLSDTKHQSHPPCNIKKLSDSTFTIEIACAGMNKDQIDAVLEENRLCISYTSELQDDPDDMYIWKGIANRSWERTFVLADDIEIKETTMKDGMLTFLLERIIPEHKKPKKIDIA